MKALKITLKSTIMFFIFAFIALFLVRIFFAEYYPNTMTSYVPSQKIKENYSTSVDSLKIYTQEPLAPYDDPKEGNFFAKGVFLVPSDGEVQVCLRYNESALGKVAAFYETTVDALMGDPLQVFDFSLHVKYDVADGTTEEKHYTLSRDDCFTEEFFVYHYVKLYFNDIDLENLIWARVDIALAGQDVAAECAEEKIFGRVLICELYEFYKGDEDNKVEYPLVPYPLSEEEKKRV